LKKLRDRVSFGFVTAFGRQTPAVAACMNEEEKKILIKWQPSEKFWISEIEISRITES
jgi:hypothetical protein